MADVDFIARLADAWDGRGNYVMRHVEQLALLRLSDLPGGHAGTRWSQLDPQTRERLVFGARLAVDLGRKAAWCLGG